ncbi:sce7726 family protein [Caballeronia sp. GAWG1-1]|uniref:sce7726 family protein n=1 Tax=Caballeronia sp. GAWG1-1 TaxID=2921742 RepID=UPI002028787E|nr:sce7726 family protein [Caballeronia sp. GAWG1-1]
MHTPQTIRSLLRDWIIRTKEHKVSDVFINELCIVDKTCRVDLVHANGRFIGFEVKSEADTLKRWPQQMDAYLRIFDEVWLCCHRKHALRGAETSDPAVGIIIIDELSSLAILRPAQYNKKVNPLALAGLLWRKELDQLCSLYGMPVIRRQLIQDVRYLVADKVPVDALKAFVLQRVKERYSMLPYNSSSSSDSSPAP